jgi:hypothetical protein
VKRALWIALDLCADPPPRALILISAGMMLVFVPFQVAFVDGTLARLHLAHLMPPLRQTLTAHGAWPALVALTLAQGTVFARRQRRELEPLLAAPVSGFHLVAGYALPSLALCLAGPAIMFPATMLGYRALAGAFPPAPARELGMSCLLVTTAGAWVTAAGVHAALRARHVQSLLARSALGYAALVAIDGLAAALRATGCDALLVPLLAAALGMGGAALWGTALRLDRERLLRRL